MPFHKLFRRLILLCATLSISVSGASAEEHSGRKIKMEGSVAADVPARLSIQDIEKIGLASATVFDPFDKVVAVYSGVWLDDFVAAFGDAAISQVTTTAIDGYSVAWTSNDWDTYRVLLATRVDDQHLTVEQKGPMRVIFVDYDSTDTEFKETLPKWVWMITNIRFD